MSERIKGLIAINIAALIFGSAALYGKLDISPVWIIGVRAVFASSALLLVGLVRREVRSPASGVAFPFRSLMLTGVILSLHWLTFFYSVQLSGVAVATLTFAAFPLFTLLFEAVMQRKPRTARYRSWHPDYYRGFTVGKN